MKGVMRFKGVERTLLDFKFSHDRDTDLLGIPCTYPKDSFIRLSFAAEEGDGFFLDWMCGRSEANKGYTGYWYDGEIVFYDELSDGQEFYRYDLRGVMPVSLMVYYDQQQGMIVYLTLTVDERIYNRFMGAEFFFLYRFWYVEPEERQQRMLSNEPQLTELYYTDENGERISSDDLMPDTVVYLNVLGENISGETSDIELTNINVDFEYQGEYLENDLLKDYTFSGNQARIELKVITSKKQENK